MKHGEALRLLDGARRAILGTSRADGRPHLVPIVFARAGSELVTAVDHKPKRTTRLVRLENLAADPRASVLADHYDEDWSQLWWVRVDGTARIVKPDESEHRRAVAPLVAKYPQYEGKSLGTAILITIHGVTGWQASAP